MQGKKTLGVSMIVKDEERNLPLSLMPIAHLADDAVVLDTGSSDRTPELARQCGARVFHAPWGGDFAKARNQALKEASTDFVLWLDADNSIEPDGFMRLKGMVSEASDDTVFVCLETVVPQGDRLWQKRAFPRRPDVLFSGSIHEQLEHPEGFKAVFTDICISHWGYLDPREAERKGLRNLNLLLSDPRTEAGDFYCLYQTGRTLLNLRRREEALGWLLRALGAGGGNPSLAAHAAIMSAGILSGLGRAEEALAMLRDLVDRRPAYGAGRFFLGKALHSMGRKAEALPELEKALELGIGDPGWGLPDGRPAFTCAMLLGGILADSGRRGEASGAFLKAASLQPDNPEPRAALAELALERGDRAEAMEQAGLALAIMPGHRRARRLMGEIAGGMH
jgi:tetratricopeptide (TPR) repeat protein